MVSKEYEKERVSASALAEAQAQIESARALPALGDCQVPSGALPSNTAPVNDNPNAVRILRVGVDSLYLSYRGQLFPDVENFLESLKAMAQSDDEVTRAQAIYVLLNHRFEVKGRGRSRFPYVLADNWFTLSLSRSTAESLPMAYVQIRSEPLTRGGVQRPVHMLNMVVAKLGEKQAETVSRVDLCVDFVTDRDFSQIRSNCWVHRSKKYQCYEVDGNFTGFTFGLGGGMSGRLYDKTKEIETSMKEWLCPLWAEVGWEGELPVWRLEFQFERVKLKEFGLSTVKEVTDNLPALWRYATAEWLRLVVPTSSDTHRSRWLTDPLWVSLQQAYFGPDGGEGLYRVPKQRLPSRSRMFVHGLGGITSFMAREGISNIDDAIGPFMKAAHAYHLEHYRHSGKTLVQYAAQKAAVKAKKYNVRFKVDDKDLDPDAYLRAKWGE